MCLNFLCLSCVSSDLRFISILLTLFIYLIICLLCVRGGGHTRGSEENCRSWFIPSIMRILGIKPDLQAWQEDPLPAEPPCLSYQVIVFFSVDHGNSDHNVNTQTKGTINQFCPDFTHESPVRRHTCQGFRSSSPRVGIPAFHSVFT